MISSVFMPKVSCQPPVPRPSAGLDAGFGDALSVALDDQPRSDVQTDESAVNERTPEQRVKPPAGRVHERAKDCTGKNAQPPKVERGADPSPTENAKVADSETGVALDPDDADAGAPAIEHDGQTAAEFVPAVVIADVSVVAAPPSDVVPVGNEDATVDTVALEGNSKGDIASPTLTTIGEAVQNDESSELAEDAAAQANAGEQEETPAPGTQRLTPRPASTRQHVDGQGRVAGHEHRHGRQETAAAASPLTPQAEVAPEPVAPSQDVAHASAQTQAATVAVIGTPAADTTPAKDSAAIADSLPEVVQEAVATSTSVDTGTASSEEEQHSGEGGTSQTTSSERSSSGRAPAMTFTLVQSADGTLRLAHSSAAQAPAMASMTPEERTENVSRLIQAMRVMSKGGVSEATVRLRPDHLGEVSIAIRVEGKTVTATVQAESAGVREWLQTQEESLRSNLSQQGLTLERLQVERDAKHERRHQQEAPAPRRPRARRSGEPEPRFEVSA